MKQPNCRLSAITAALILAACLSSHAAAQGQNSPWQSIGPVSVTSLNYGPASGRVTALALDPSDPTGNSLFIGATGGGIWHSANAASSTIGNITFTALTDTLSTLQTTTVCGQSTPVTLPSISIGALSVQPGATGVVLAGTGDPNDAFDSYYGDGVLYTASGGSTWVLLSNSCDLQANLSNQNYYFTGEAFAGFAWSTKYTQTVVAAVTQAYRGYLEEATLAGRSYEGLYYSSDGGADWYLATIEDSSNSFVQGPAIIFSQPDGNAATSVVWNPVRQLFIAAIRYHGYYSSPDGVTWTRLANQPGTNLTSRNCPTNTGVGSSGSGVNQSCPIFRGTLAVNPVSGDTFAWTVDINSQDQGIWQDQCIISNGVCTNQNITFGTQLNTSVLETNTTNGAKTIPAGDYDLTLAAVPNQQDTELFAGDTDLWQCSIYNGCTWRNTTNAYTCMSAQVAAFQHALVWNASNTAELFIGNDSGLWRSTDRVGETGAVCNSTDNTHFQNLNGALGSLAEVGSLSVASTNANTLLAGLGVIGTAGVKGTSTPPSVWPQVLGGFGGMVLIDPTNNQNWYVNNQVGVAINLCSQSGACTNSTFGSGPVITEADVSDDGYMMWAPAPFLVDPLNDAQMLVATCRIWRGPVNGSTWSTSNALSGMLDGTANTYCSGDAIVRSLASQTVSGGPNEIIYAGMYGEGINPSNVPGHIFSATYNPANNSQPTWNDLTANPVTNLSAGFNSLGYDVTGIYIDPHDGTGNTIYVTLGGVPSLLINSSAILSSTNGGASWQSIQSNLPVIPMNGVAVDPQNANIVYVATDNGVYYTSAITTCATSGSNCWAPYGTGLPNTAVAQLVASPIGTNPQVLTAGTYGRGIWQAPLYTSGTTLTTATLTPNTVNFGNQVEYTSSSATVITIKNTGTVALTPSLITMNGNFTETDNCVGQTINANKTCTINVVFTPASLGALTGSMTVSANVSGGQLSASLSGTGIAPGNMTLVPGSWNFGSVQIGQPSSTESFSLTNSGGTAVTISSVKATSPFSISSNSCGSSLAANSACAISVLFTPTAQGAASGTLTMTGSAATQTANLSGTGLTAPTAQLSFTKYTFPNTAINTSSAQATLTLTNNGDEPLNQISDSVNGYFSVTTNCGTTLAGHSSCSFFIVFTPLTIVTGYTQPLYISTALGQQTVTLTGTGVADPVIAFTKTVNTYGSWVVGTSSYNYVYNLQNQGQAAVSGLSANLTGQGASSFSFGSGGSNPCGTSLNAGTTCGYGVIFTPRTVGYIQANLVATATYPITQSSSLLVWGTGVAPAIFSVYPSSLNFTSVAEGTTSASQILYVKNVGSTALTDMQFSITSGASYFALNSSTTCTASLGAGKYCNIFITFAPTSTNEVYGTLTLSSASNAAAPATVSLQGNGTPPSTLITSVSEIDFGNQTTGQASASQTLTLSANGSSSVSGLSFSVPGGSGFTVQAGTCGTTLPKNGSCTELVSFAPSLTGYQTAYLTISSTTQYVSPVTVLLTGTGLAPAIIQPSPAQLNFGSVIIGQTSAATQLSITNGGGSALTGLALQVSGNFALTQNNCPSTLTAGASCTASLTFTPAQNGQLNGNLSITTTTPGAANVNVPLTGYGLTSGSLTIAPSTVNFGTETLSQSTAAQPFTLTNTGGGAANGLSITTTGNFSVSGQTTCGASLAGGASCTIYIIFTPTSVGSLSGQLQVSSTTQGVPKVYAGLTGTGKSGANLTVTPTQLSFPNTAVNTTSAAMTFVLSNPGTATANGINIQSTGSFTNSTCPASLAAGASCTVSVYFSPSQQGALTGTTTASSTTTGVAAVQVSLSGTATAPPSLSLNPTSLAFPNTSVSTTSAPMSITITNPGTASLATPSFSITGDFQIQSNGCTQSLAAGASCTASIVFAPTVIGGRTGFLTVSSTTNGVTSVIAPLSGTSVGPAQLSTSTQNITFPNLALGQISAPQAITVTVTGGAGVTNIQAVADPGFIVSQNTCTGTLQDGATCIIAVEFAPTVIGNYQGQLIINGTGVQYPVSVGLTGAVYAPPTLQSSNGQLSFQTTGVGITSAPSTIQLSNTSPNVDITGLQLVIQGDQSFQLSGTTCASTLPAGTNCTASITFTPSAAGPAQPAWLVAVSSNATGPLSIPLYGTGLSFTFEASGQTSVTVASGQTANFNFTITIPSTTPPTGNLQAVFTLSCGTLPLNTQCQFIPQNCQSNCQPITTITASTQSPGYATLSLLTGTASSTAKKSITHSYALFLPLLLLPLALRKRRRLLLPLVLLVAIVATMSSCTEARLIGGGPGGGGSNNNTPPGTYTIPVNVTADGLTQQTTVTVTVD
jgi:hypothetical protein